MKTIEIMVVISSHTKIKIIETIENNRNYDRDFKSKFQLLFRRVNIYDIVCISFFTFIIWDSIMYGKKGKGQRGSEVTYSQVIVDTLLVII